MNEQDRINAQKQMSQKEKNIVMIELCSLLIVSNLGYSPLIQALTNSLKVEAINL